MIQPDGQLLRLTLPASYSQPSMLIHRLSLSLSPPPPPPPPCSHFSVFHSPYGTAVCSTLSPPSLITPLLHEGLTHSHTDDHHALPCQNRQTRHPSTELVCSSWGRPKQAHPPPASIQLRRPRAGDQRRDHGASSLKAPPDLRQRPQHRRGGAQGGSPGLGRQEGYRAPQSHQLQRWW